MERWCKIIKVDSRDILVQRLVSKTDGEHLHITVRVEKGQYNVKLSEGSGPEAKEKIRILFNKYGKKDAEELINSFKLNSNGKPNTENRKKED